MYYLRMSNHRSTYIIYDLAELDTPTWLYMYIYSFHYFPFFFSYNWLCTYHRNIFLFRYPFVAVHTFEDMPPLGCEALLQCRVFGHS